MTDKLPERRAQIDALVETAEWFTCLNQDNAVIATSLRPGKRNAINEMRRLRRRRIFDRLRLVKEGAEPPDTRWHPDE